MGRGVRHVAGRVGAIRRAPSQADALPSLTAFRILTLPFGLLPWLVKGLRVLPLLGQGALGLSALPRAGVAYFFVANAVFGILLGVFYARLRDRRRVGSAA